MLIFFERVALWLNLCCHFWISLTSSTNYYLMQEHIFKEHVENQFSNLKKAALEQHIINKISSTIKKQISNQTSQRKRTVKQSQLLNATDPKKIVTYLMAWYNQKLGLCPKSKNKKFDERLASLKKLGTFVEVNKFYKLINPQSSKEVKQFLNLRRKIVLGSNQQFKNQYQALRQDFMNYSPQLLNILKKNLQSKGSQIKEMQKAKSQQKVLVNQGSHSENQYIFQKKLLQSSSKNNCSFFKLRQVNKEIVSEQEKVLSLLLHQPGSQKFVSMNLKNFRKVLNRLMWEYNRQGKYRQLQKRKPPSRQVPKSVKMKRNSIQSSVQIRELKNKFQQFSSTCQTLQRDIKDNRNQNMLKCMRIYKQHNRDLDEFSSGLSKAKLQCWDILFQDFDGRPVSKISRKKRKNLISLL